MVAPPSPPPLPQKTLPREINDQAGDSLQDVQRYEEKARFGAQLASLLNLGNVRTAADSLQGHSWALDWPRPGV